MGETSANIGRIFARSSLAAQFWSTGRCGKLSVTPPVVNFRADRTTRDGGSAADHPQITLPIGAVSHLEAPENDYQGFTAPFYRIPPLFRFTIALRVFLHAHPRAVWDGGRAQLPLLRVEWGNDFLGLPVCCTGPQPSYQARGFTATV